jgi:hypothetical protein
MTDDLDPRYWGPPPTRWQLFTARLWWLKLWRRRDKMKRANLDGRPLPDEVDEETIARLVAEAEAGIPVEKLRPSTWNYQTSTMAVSPSVIAGGQRHVLVGKSEVTNVHADLVTRRRQDPIGQAIIDTVSAMDADATVEGVITAVSAHYPPAMVRETYWQLIADNRLARSADGHLSLP